MSALFWVSVVRLGLTFSSYDRLRASFLPAQSFSPGSEHRGQGVAKAVRRAARLVPVASCLTQALAAQIMLSRRHVSSTLHLGVAMPTGGAFEAHAWLEADGAVLLGGPRRDLARYRTIKSYGPTAA